MRARYGLMLFLTVAGPLRAQSATLRLTPSRLTLDPGASLRVTVESPPAGRLEWSAEPGDVAGVDSTGLVVALRPGVARVTARTAGGSGHVVVHVNPNPASVIRLVGAPDTLMAGGAGVLRPVALDRNGEPIRHATFTFGSSNEGVAVVDQTGTVHARNDGAAILVATSGPARVEHRLTVLRNRLRTITINGPGSAAAGDVVRLGVTALDQRELPVAGVVVHWSVSGPAARVESDGSFVADLPGTYLVTATAGPVAGSRPIRITPRRTRLALIETAPGPAVPQGSAESDALRLVPAGREGLEVRRGDVLLGRFIPEVPGGVPYGTAMLVTHFNAADSALLVAGTIRPPVTEPDALPSGFLAAVSLDDPEWPLELARLTCAEGPVEDLLVRAQVVAVRCGEVLRVLDFEGEVRGDPVRQGREIARLGQVSRVAFDSEGRLLVAHRNGSTRAFRIGQVEE